MSFNKDEKTDPTCDNINCEDKVNIEETFVNLNYVKKELNDEVLEFEERQYKIALVFGNIFSESSSEQKNTRDSLVGFSDDDVIMERTTESVKLEKIKEEDGNLLRNENKQFYCNGCGGDYDQYCGNCSSLSYILNNLTPNLNPALDLNDIPINMLEIRDVSGRQGVFALKTIPKSIILGPFEGIAPIQGTNGFEWKIKDKKLVSDQNGNWMKYIESVVNYTSKNLSIFQFDGILYFETSREIQEGEELLICYGVEDKLLQIDKEEESSIVPVKKEEYPKVFACTLCCLGFRLEKCLMEHKSKCPQRTHDGSIEDFEIIQCRCCKMWLEQQEHQESHILHCVNNYKKLRHNYPDFKSRNVDEVGLYGNDEISTPIQGDKSWLPQTEVIDFKILHGTHMTVSTYSNISEKKYKCSKCLFETNYRNNIKAHIFTHSDIKPYQCGVCKKNFTQKGTLKQHLIHQHSNTKEYNCSACSYQTHNQYHMKLHMKNKHSATSEKEYKCSECSFQTNYKHNLKSHLNTHRDVKPFQCGLCQKTFNQRSYLKEHINNHHINSSGKKYKCSECSFQTNYNNHLKLHLNTHTNSNFNKTKRHFDITLDAIEKDYKCIECSYQTNYKHNLKSHMKTHSDIKPYHCDFCEMKFNQKYGLKVHIKEKHSSISEKQYKCPECSYQANHKGKLKIHLNTHTGVKPFECHLCENKFIQKVHLKQHLKNKHLDTNEKDYKCPQCSYQTNYKHNFERHLNTHPDVKPFRGDICKEI